MLRKGHFKGGRFERMAELSGRIKMMEQGQLRLGHGKYTSIHGIDAVYYDYRTMLGAGFDSKLAYRVALADGSTVGSISILESKYRRVFGGNPESELGRGIKNPLKAPPYFRQMSDDWIDKVTEKLLGHGDPIRRQMGQVIERGYSGGRLINVLTGEGRSLLYRMP